MKMQQGMTGSPCVLLWPLLRVCLSVRVLNGRAGRAAVGGTKPVGHGDRLQHSAESGCCRGGNAHLGGPSFTDAVEGFPGVLILFSFTLV